MSAGTALRHEVGGAIVVAGVIGFKVHGKAQAETAARDALVALCEGDAACATAVETHVEACFAAAYDAGGRRRSASLDGEDLVQCINSRSGVDWFGFDPDAK